MDIEYVRKVLAKEYGIHTLKELDMAIKNAEKPDISAMVVVPRNSPKKEKKGKKEKCSRN